MESEKRASEWIVKELSKSKSGEWGCVQTREFWSTGEQVYMRPGHHWIYEFGDTGNDTSSTTSHVGDLSMHTVLQRRPCSLDQVVVQQSGRECVGIFPTNFSIFLH